MRLSRDVGRSIASALALLLVSCSDSGANPTSPTSVAVAPSSTGSTSAGTTSAGSTPTTDVTPASASTALPTLPSVPGTSTSATATATTLPTARAIAAELTAAERGIRDITLSESEIAAYGRRQQRAYRQLARHPELQEMVAANVPADVADAVAFNLAARQAVVDHAAGSTPSEPSPTLPAWTIIEPRPIEELLGYYAEASAASGVPWEYLAAINFVETRMGRISGASSAGALGPMQFLPTTWAACCIGDIMDPRDAIIGAAQYLVDEGAPADMRAALYGYNPNDGYVGSVMAYAANLESDPLAYRGYHAWEVYVGSVAGTVRLPVGYSAEEPVDARAYLREHPDDAL